ncbi:E3 ubiquitin-protein ligase TRIM71-like [Glandiceps talaboti]
MAAATQEPTMQEEIDELYLTCRVCLDRYKNAKLLVCNHSFCEHCLVRLAGDRTFFNCPICRRRCILPVGGVKRLPSSMTLNGIVEIYDIKEKQRDGSPCQSCQTEPSVSRCVDCSLDICTICVNVHRKIPSTKQHRLVAIEEFERAKLGDQLLQTKPIYCSNHSTNIVDTYCHTCQMCICSECLQQCHVKPHHHSTSLVDASWEFLDDMKKRMSHLEDKGKDIVECYDSVKNTLDEATQKFEEEVDALKQHSQDAIEKATEIIKTREDVLLNQLKTSHDKITGILQTHVKEYGDTAKLIKNTKVSVESLMRYGSAAQLMAMKSDMVNKILDLYAASSNQLNKPSPQETPIDPKLATSPFTILNTSVPNTTRVGEKVHISVAPTTATIPRTVAERAKLEAALEMPNDNIKKSFIKTPHSRHNKTYVTFSPRIEGQHKFSVCNHGNSILCSPYSTNVLPGWKLEQSISGHGDGELGLDWPLAVTVNRGNDIIIADSGNSRLQIIDRKEGKISKLQFTGFSKPLNPSGVAVTSQNIYYISDCCEFDHSGKNVVNGNNQIIVSNSAGDVLQCLGKGVVKQPCGVCCGTQNNILYVVDNWLHCIHMFNTKTYAYIKSFGEEGSDPGQFKYPQYATVNSKGHVIVSDTSNHRIQILNSNGEYLFHFGKKGNRRAQFNDPLGVATDNHDNIYVADSGNHRVQKFDYKGRFVCSIDNDSLGMPYDLTVTQDDPCKIVILDNVNQSVLLFS